MAKPENNKIRGKDHILNTLKYLIESFDFAHLPNDQYKFLQSNYSKLKQIRNNRWNINFEPLELPILNNDLRNHEPFLFIGGVVEGIGEEITWSSLSVAITFKTKSSNISDQTKSCCLPTYQQKNRIVRRYHFDYQPDEQDKPTYHIQYGGKLPSIDCFKNVHYCLEHFLERPRLHYPPMDIVLIIDLFIREFITPLKKLKEEPYWNNLVLKSQELWWKKYWKLISSYVENPASKTIHEMMYNEKNEF